MDDSSVFQQESECDGLDTSINVDVARETSLSITTTQRKEEASSPLTAGAGSSTSPEQLYLVKTVATSHSPASLAGGASASPVTSGVTENRIPDAQRPLPIATEKQSPARRGSGSSDAVGPASLSTAHSGSSSPSSSYAGVPAGALDSSTTRPMGGGGAFASARTGTSVRDEAKMAYSGPVREKPLVPENIQKGKTGAATPQLISVAAPKSQLRAAPTGGSDSDTDNDGQGSDTGSATIGSPQRRHLAAAAAAAAAAAEEEEDEDEQQFVDEFGFVIDETQREMDAKLVQGINGRQVSRREIKWANMAADWSRTNHKMHAKLKERCRKGIPSRLRGVAWQLLLGSRVLMMSAENEGVYVALRDKKLRDKEVDEVLGRDLTRTFPNHILFRDEGGVGQTFLRNVLHAYAGCDPEVGYTQGMAFIVGALSTQMAEEESFWALHELMYNERYKMRELFKPGFPLLHQFFYQLKRLLARLLPKLHRHFEELQIEPSFYASQWFMTLFVYHFPFRALLRIWDIFFSEGWKIIFRTGIALMKWEEKRLLAMPFDELLPALKALQEGKDTKELVSRAHRVKFKTAELNRYGDEYWAKMGVKPQV